MFFDVTVFFSHFFVRISQKENKFFLLFLYYKKAYPFTLILYVDVQVDMRYEIEFFYKYYTSPYRLLKDSFQRNFSLFNKFYEQSL